jgi:hypothetical protein
MLWEIQEVLKCKSIFWRLVISSISCAFCHCRVRDGRMYMSRLGITYLGAIPILVIILSHQARNLQIMAAGTSANLYKISKARWAVRKFKSISKLEDLPGVDNHALFAPINDISHEVNEEVHVAQIRAMTLWSVSQFKKRWWCLAWTDVHRI